MSYFAQPRLNSPYKQKYLYNDLGELVPRQQLQQQQQQQQQQQINGPLMLDNRRNTNDITSNDNNIMLKQPQQYQDLLKQFKVIYPDKQQQKQQQQLLHQELNSIQPGLLTKSKGFFSQKLQQQQQYYQNPEFISKYSLSKENSNNNNPTSISNSNNNISTEPSSSSNYQKQQLPSSLLLSQKQQDFIIQKNNINNRYYSNNPINSIPPQVPTALRDVSPFQRASQRLLSEASLPNKERHLSQPSLESYNNDKSYQQLRDNNNNSFKYPRNSSIIPTSQEPLSSSQSQIRPPSSQSSSFQLLTRVGSKSPLVKRREDKAAYEEKQLQRPINDGHLFDKEIYSHLRQQYPNKNIKHHVDLSNRIGLKEGLAENAPPLVQNEMEFRKSVRKLFRLDNKGILGRGRNNNNNNDYDYENKKEQIMRQIQNQSEQSQLQLQSMERVSRQYNLSEGDSLNQMVIVSKQIRDFKETIMRLANPKQAEVVRKAVERRIAAKARQDDRRKRLMALLGIDVYIAPRQADMESRNKIW